MEHWSHSSILPASSEDEKPTRSGRVLAVTSGNVQNHALDTKEGIENERPTGLGTPSNSGSKLALSHYAPPRPTLASNDPQTLLRLQARRHRREHDHLDQRHRPDPYRWEGSRLGPRPTPDPDRCYLNHKKYLDYRARQRCDRGSDGEPVWSNQLEEAFQDALIAIPWMGRKKKSQHGKPNGRNELVAEWIYRATGKRRTRKQVSSHIQVLTGLLKDVPQWQALTKPTDNPNCDGPDDMEYYGNSIAVKVHQKYHGSYLDTGAHSNMSQVGGLPPPEHTLGSSTAPSNSVSVTVLNFEMWVSPPYQTDEALHHYTRLQSTYFSSNPMPLENIKDWRYTFPNLPAILKKRSAFENYDIIFLEASFLLMSDFPPRSSRLGISLELDFLHSNNGNIAALERRLCEWTCTTHVYQNGLYVKAPTRQDCHGVGLGKVEPTFESTWWANTFIKLTEKRRRAEDTKDEASIRAADEESRSFFQSLSVMQEIRARPPRNHSSQAEHPDEHGGAILLWKFSQAHPTYVGTTKWQRLIPPPDRTTTNSPPPNVDKTALPPLAMDAMVGDTPHPPTFQTHTLFLDEHDGFEFPRYADGIEDGANVMIQDNFDMNFKEEDIANFAAMHHSFEMPLATEDGMDGGFHALDPMHFDMESHELDAGQHNLGQGPTNNFFETELHQPRSGSESPQQIYPSQGHLDCGSIEPAHRQPLTHFDHNTHELLQASLALPDAAQHDGEDEALRAALVAASAMSDLGARDLAHRPSTRQEEYPQDALGYWEATAATRPPLQAQTSYASQHSPVSSTYEIVSNPANTEALNANRHTADLSSHMFSAASHEAALPGSEDHDSTHADLFADNPHRHYGIEPSVPAGEDTHGDSFVEIKLEEVQGSTTP